MNATLRPDAADRQARQQTVWLVHLPWARADYPSLALGTLKSVLKRRGHDAAVRNYNLAFAAAIGLEAYHEIADDQEVLLGEQVFAQLLHPERLDDERFVYGIDKAVGLERFMALTDQAQLFIDSLRDQILAAGVDIVGLTTTFYQRASSLALAQALKQASDPPLVALGGAACELPMGRALAETYGAVDVVFHGSAEKSLPAWVDRVAEGRRDYADLHGICYRKAPDEPAVRVGRQAPEMALDSVPAPDFDDYLRERESLGFPAGQPWLYSFETSRGCWWGVKNHCTFCGLNGQQMAFRAKSVPVIVEQLRDLPDTGHGRRQVQFTDNILHHEFLESLVPALGDIAHLSYFFEIKANLREDHVARLAANRVSAIQPGIERLHDKPLKLMRKGVSAAQNVQLLRWCAEFGITTVYNIITGFPGESRDQIDEEIALVRQLHHLPPPNGSAPLRLDRFSPYHRDPAAYGLRTVGPMASERYLFYGAANVDDLAYHFDLAYLDDTAERLGEAWSALHDAVGAWRQAYRPGLLTARRDGEAILVCDRRDPQQAYEIELTGAAARLITVCNAAQPLHRVRAALAEADELVSELHRLGLIIHGGTWVLAAPVETKSGKAHQQREAHACVPAS